MNNKGLAILAIIVLLILLFAYYDYTVNTTQQGGLPPDKGVLAVSVVPSTLHPSVTVDGNVVGQAPVNVSIDSGSHTVAFGDMQGYTKPDPFSVEVLAGQTVNVVGYYTVAGQTGGTGTLAVFTQPVSGEVYVDGVDVGVAPIVRNYEAGKNYVVSFGDVVGYVTPQSHTVWLPSDQTVTVNGVYTAVVTPNTAVVSISTTPVQGRIFIDGVEEGVGSLSWSVAVGSSVRIGFGGYQGYVTPPEQTVYAAEAKTYVVVGTYTTVPEAGKVKLSVYVRNSEGVGIQGIEIDVFGVGVTSQTGYTNLDGLVIFSVPQNSQLSVRAGIVTVEPNPATMQVGTSDRAVYFSTSRAILSVIPTDIGAVSLYVVVAVVMVVSVLLVSRYLKDIIADVRDLISP